MPEEQKAVMLKLHPMLLANAVMIVWEWEDKDGEACECCGGHERVWQHAFSLN